ncbi:MAG: hypothetical protein PVJ72_16010 [Gammaproteobacteria bacterium]|jgi:hypothetical protein
MTQAQSFVNDFLFDREQNNLRSRLSYELNQKEFFQRIDAIPELIGAGVIYTNGATAVKLREFQPICYLNPVYVVLKEAPPLNKKTELQAELESNPRNSKLVGELVGAGLSCGAAALSWIVIVGASAAVPVSGGASTAVVVLTYSAAIASTAQCANSILRTGGEIVEPSLNDWLDSQEWYTNTTTALDIISVAGAAGAGFATIKTAITVRAATGQSFLTVLKGMSRAERKRLTEEIIRVNHPGISNGALKAMVRSRLYPKRYSNIQITEALKLQMKDALGATLSFTGSATSGVVKSLAIGIYEGIPE